MIQTSKPPFEQELYGFDKRRILSFFYQYQYLQNAWVEKTEQEDPSKMSLQERTHLTGKILQTAPAEWKKKFEELDKKLSAKDKNLSIYQRTTKGKKK